MDAITFLDKMSWILAKNSSKDIALAGSDSSMPANTGVTRSLSPLKKKTTRFHAY